jgi:hypothetical protein
METETESTPELLPSDDVFETNASLEYSPSVTSPVASD